MCKCNQVINNRKFEKVSKETWMKALPKCNTYTENEWSRLHDLIKLPVRKTLKSSGYDFHIPMDITLKVGEDIVIPTGVKVSMNDDNELLITPRSGLGFKFYTRLANTVGKIDADYYNNEDNEGHIFVKLRNEGNTEMAINHDDAFCQGSFYIYLTTNDDNADGIRSGGLGSTSVPVEG